MIESKTRLRTAVITGLGSFTVIVFWPAGTTDWLEGWVYLLLTMAHLLASFLYLRRVNAAVIEHRLRVGTGTKRWDKLWIALFTPCFLSIYVIAGFDAVRFEWSTMPCSLWFPGLALWLTGNTLVTWSMGVNPFFEKTVRIQSERGHRVIDTGPYSFVRHPGYLGFFSWSLSTPLLLGSWWAFLPAGLCVASLVIRTALEDQMLRAELTGYADYTTRVRYRLVPKIW